MLGDIVGRSLLTARSYYFTLAGERAAPIAASSAERLIAGKASPIDLPALTVSHDICLVGGVLVLFEDDKPRFVANCGLWPIARVPDATDRGFKFEEKAFRAVAPVLARQLKLSNTESLTRLTGYLENPVVGLMPIDHTVQHKAMTREVAHRYTAEMFGAGVSRYETLDLISGRTVPGGIALDAAFVTRAVRSPSPLETWITDTDGSFSAERIREREVDGKSLVDARIEVTAPSGTPIGILATVPGERWGEDRAHLGAFAAEWQDMETALAEGAAAAAGDEEPGWLAPGIWQRIRAGYPELSTDVEHFEANRAAITSLNVDDIEGEPNEYVRFRGAIASTVAVQRALAFGIGIAP